MNNLRYFMKIAEETAKLSTCIAYQVGCVFIKDKRIILTSYNGVASGKEHCNDKFTAENYKDLNHHEWSKNNELHAEQNGISYAAKNGIPLKDCSMFVTLMPCIDCAKQILASGIKTVYYKDEYKNSDGVKFLKEHKIDCFQFNFDYISETEYLMGDDK